MPQFEKHLSRTSARIKGSWDWGTDTGVGGAASGQRDIISAHVVPQLQPITELVGQSWPPVT